MTNKAMAQIGNHFPAAAKVTDFTNPSHDFGSLLLADVIDSVLKNPQKQFDGVVDDQVPGLSSEKTLHFLVKHPPSSRRLRHQIQFALAQSGYPLQQITCRVRKRTLTLLGAANRFFHLQIAIQIAMRFAGGREVRSEVAVAGHFPKSPTSNLS